MKMINSGHIFMNIKICTDDDGQFQGLIYNF